MTRQLTADEEMVLEAMLTSKTGITHRDFKGMSEDRLREIIDAIDALLIEDLGGDGIVRGKIRVDH